MVGIAPEAYNRVREPTRRPLVKKWKLAAAGLLGLGALVATNWEPEPKATMHELDWENGHVPEGGRRYRSLGQFTHHQKELLSMLVPLAEVYLRHAIPPAFREQIMIVTAMADCCPT
jgi:hypothetical protein